MDDFFSAPSLLTAVDVHDDDNVDQFAKAIAGRFNSTDRPLFTTRLTLAPSTTTAGVATEKAHNASAPSPNTPPNVFRAVVGADSKGPSQPSSSPATPLSRLTLSSMSPRPPSSVAASTSKLMAPPLDFTVVTAVTLQQVLATPNILILDIRPHSAYSASRLPHAISLSVPSTLLKRPAFTLQKLGTMLSSSTARSRFSGWSKASRILAYDADSAALHEGSNLLGLLRKFRAEGFKGDIAWLQGGIQSLWRDRRQWVDEGPVSEDEEEYESPSFLRAGDLPKTAFQHASTTTIHTRGKVNSSPTAFFGPSGLAKSTSVNSQPNNQTTPMLRMAANPFYDNIRQNIELSQGITDRIPLRLSPTVAARTRELPFPWLREIAETAGRDEGTEALAMQFYRIELGEQRRMQGIMAHHSTQSGVAEEVAGNVTAEKEKETSPFPFSITAGVEKGTKNRYRNIWPFEHARVRLKSQEHDDYVNASFVQPLGTRRRYIATQGPLPSTFTDFWTIVWEQRVQVIVMLTKQFEGGTIKCGNYWADGQYGPYQLKCVSTSGAKDEEDPGGLNRIGSTSGGFFALNPLDWKESKVGEDDKHNHTICRKFELSHAAYPHKKPRIITQLQYLGWPDMNVPATPKGLLSFMRQVDELVDQTNAEPDSEDDTRKSRPALLHCSAGVGRTGAFIVIDAVLDGVRRELRRTIAELKKNRAITHKDSESNEGIRGLDAMDVDISTAPATHTMSSFPTASSSVSFSKSIESTPRTARTPSNSLLSMAGLSEPSGPSQEGNEKSSVTDTTASSAFSSAPLSSYKTYRAAQMNETTLLPSESSSPFRSMQLAMTSRRSLAQASDMAGKRTTTRRVLADFTVADADSMFTSAALNPAFAMDVESIQPQSKPFTSSSSSGEGSASGGDLASSSSASGSSGRNRHLPSAVGKLSTSEDVPGPIDQSDSDSFIPVRLSLKSRNDDGSGSRSESGEGGPSTSGGSVSAGDYSSASSSGIRSSSISSGPYAASALCITSSSNGAQAHFDDSPHTHPHHLLRGVMHKPSLLAPKPRLPVHPSDLLESSGTPSVNALPSRLRLESKSSSASLSSTEESSTLFPSSAHRESSETLLSTHDSESPEPGEQPKPEMRHLAGTSFDYVVPRNLHGDDSPPLLSSLEEPIREILEDMREQRMSLCQSLRQYVFVHNAIIEGALQIADEERRRAGINDLNLSCGMQSESVESIASQSSSQTTGKRGASPTELPKEDKKGDVALAKRPSIKRGKSLSASSCGSSTGETGLSC